MNRPRRTTAVAALALALTTALVGCRSGDADDSATDSRADADADADADAGAAAPAEEGAFPATITHKFGTTEVTAAPARVVSVGLTEQDTLLALGVAPVGVTKWFGEAPGEIFPWATDELEALGGEIPEVLSDVDGVQVEKVAQLDPDLIVGVYSGMTQHEYELLSEIAPVVASPDKVDYTTSWQVGTELIGAALGKPDEAAELVEDVEGQLHAAAEAHPEFEGRQAAVVTAYEGLFVYGAGDPRGQMLEELGFEFPEILEDPDATEFGWSLSAERTSDLDDLDIAVWLDYGITGKAIKDLFEGTEAHEEGRWFSISEGDGAYYVAQSMVTPLSIPYVLERYVPQLAAAVDGDPATEPPASSS